LGQLVSVRVRVEPVFLFQSRPPVPVLNLNVVEMTEPTHVAHVTAARTLALNVRGLGGFGTEPHATPKVLVAEPIEERAIPSVGEP
jgi:hypothetical protein